MGRTFRKNDRWKKDRRDQNFRKSKKFKEFKGGHPQTRPHLPQVEEPTESDDSY